MDDVYKYNITENKIKALLDEIVKNEGIINSKRTATNGYKMGDGYMSYWTMITLTGENKSLNLAIKSAPRTEEYRKVMSTRKSFLREIYFYKTIAPLFESFTDIKCIPKCYKTVSEENGELLIFENLKSSGFQLWDCKVPMDTFHIIDVLEQFSKFHAISLALKYHKPDEFLKVTGGLDNIFGAKLMDSFNKFVEKTINKLIIILHQDVAMCKALENFKNSLSDFSELLANSKNDRGVVIHGDCWCNNIMFKYQMSGKPKLPTETKLIDFQLTGIANPVIDIANFLFLSCDTNALDQIPTFLLHYYRTLSRALRDMNCIPDGIYPEQAFYNDWKLYGKFGLLMGCTEFYVMMREDDEKVSIDNLDEKMLSSMMEGDIKNKDEADRRLCNVAKYMFENGLIE